MAGLIDKGEGDDHKKEDAALAAKDDGTRYWDDDPGILTGASGIALALLAATTSIEPEWDRMLLVSTLKQG